MQDIVPNDISQPRRVNVLGKNAVVDAGVWRGRQME